ncbi:MAG: thioredoxin domain-containing protein [Betaproteobacteria bacterium]|nr:thioredoxin domain-containing protein [Betaproteobacteria bacterium]
MSNRLANETSPYLRQHAENPVDWHPWGEEALRLAREQDKPILLSIGYSACHWCHVMAHESFEDPEIAARMNEHFVNVKVDREERPDLDQIYQTAHHMLTQRSGGWPLTMFLTPDGAPFFGGTYFPKAPRYGMPGFRDLLPTIATAYREKRDDIAKQNSAFAEALARILPAAPCGEVELKRAPLDAAVRELSQLFDDVHGGIGRAPKFPHPHEFASCLRRHALDGSEIALTMVRLTLSRMAEGGIYDQLGGGFCRYSVDEYWAIPHFEKMLYDNGALLALYTDAWLATDEPLFAKVVAETAGWVMREMQSAEGGYYSSLDADSEHEEGKFYVWTPHEVRQRLTAEEYAVVEPHYGLDAPANFEGEYWHLRVMKPLAFVAKRLGIPLAECKARLASARQKLFAAREARARPGRDDKVLTSWNGLMIKGMARAARVFGEPRWLDSARRAAAFVRATMWREETGAHAVRGRLLATYRDGRAQLNAYLDDYAFTLDALLELMQAEFRADDLGFARELADALLARFEDPREGGFFFTSHDHEKLFHRPKNAHDDATPSGNGVAALALQRLAHLLGEPRYLAATERTLKLFYPALERQPVSFASLATALEEHLAPPQIVIVRGPRGDVAQWARLLARSYRPATLVLPIPEGMHGLPPALDKRASDGVNAWVCRGVKCLPPVRDPAALERVLAGEAG